MDNNVISVMKRSEYKYILTKDQLVLFKSMILEHMKVDQYGLTTISSIYYDTPDYRLIRNSIEKPIYKEKIRLRSYGLADSTKKVFLELKRKSEGIVYKRRIALSEDSAIDFFNNNASLGEDQIAKEITYFRDYYKKLIPQIIILYDRLAYKEINNGDLRLTIDENPRYRTYKFNLHTSNEGVLLLDEGSAILEVKVQQEIPLWLTNILSKLKIYKTSFSKVGEAYKRILQKKQYQTDILRSQHHEIII